MRAENVNSLFKSEKYNNNNNKNNNNNNNNNNNYGIYIGHLHMLNALYNTLRGT